MGLIKFPIRRRKQQQQQPGHPGTPVPSVASSSATSRTASQINPDGALKKSNDRKSARSTSASGSGGKGTTSKTPHQPVDARFPDADVATDASGSRTATSSTAGGGGVGGSWGAPNARGAYAADGGNVGSPNSNDVARPSNGDGGGEAAFGKANVAGMNGPVRATVKSRNNAGSARKYSMGQAALLTGGGAAIAGSAANSPGRRQRRLDPPTGVDEESIQQSRKMARELRAAMQREMSLHRTATSTSEEGRGGGGCGDASLNSGPGIDGNNGSIKGENNGNGKWWHWDGGTSNSSTVQQQQESPVLFTMDDGAPISNTDANTNTNVGNSGEGGVTATGTKASKRKVLAGAASAASAASATRMTLSLSSSRSSRGISFDSLDDKNKDASRLNDDEPIQSEATTKPANDRSNEDDEDISVHNSACLCGDSLNDVDDDDGGQHPGLTEDDGGTYATYDDETYGTYDKDDDYDDVDGDEDGTMDSYADSMYSDDDDSGSRHTIEDPSSKKKSSSWGWFGFGGGDVEDDPTMDYGSSHSGTLTKESYDQDDGKKNSPGRENMHSNENESRSMKQKLIAMKHVPSFTKKKMKSPETGGKLRQEDDGTAESTASATGSQRSSTSSKKRWGIIGTSARAKIGGTDARLLDTDERQRELCCSKHGAVDNLVIRQYADVPAPKEADHIVVKVLASTVSAGDCAIRLMGDPNKKPEFDVPGFHAVGLIHALGAKVDIDRFHLDDPVAALLSHGGGNAKYVSVPMSCVIKLPEDASHEDIICLVSNYLAAYQCLKLAKNEGAPLTYANVLIQGGSTPVGQALVELALREGAKVYATAHKMHEEHLTKLGCKWLAMKPKKWLPLLGGKMDVVVDNLGLDGYESSYQALTPQGKLVCNTSNHCTVPLQMQDDSSFCLGLNDRGMDSWWAGLKAKYVWNRAIFYDVNESYEKNPKMFAHELHYLICKLQRGEISPKVAGKVSLNQVPKAQKLIEKGLPNGTVICLPWKRLDPKQKVKHIRG